MDIPNLAKGERRGASLDELDLNLLRVFVVLMQERSVTRAADRLGRTQSAVSHSLAKLRSFFEDDLFNRDSGFMEPTTKATELAFSISNALMDIQGAVDRHLNFEPRDTVRKFRIGLSDYTALAFLPQLSKRFIGEAPHATLSVTHAREPEVADLLKSGELDCAVLGNASIYNPELRSTVIAKDKLVCVGWQKNGALDDGLTLDRYLEAPHLQISADGVSEGAADRALRELNLNRRVVETIPHYMVAPWVIKGTGLLTILGDSILFAMGSDSEIAVVRPPLELPDVSISLIYDRVRENDPSHVWLRQLVGSVASEQQVRKTSLYKNFSSD